MCTEFEARVLFWQDEVSKMSTEDLQAMQDRLVAKMRQEPTTLEVIQWSAVREVLDLQRHTAQQDQQRKDQEQGKPQRNPTKSNLPEDLKPI